MNFLKRLQASYFYERIRAVIKYGYITNNSDLYIAPAGEKGEGLYTSKFIKQGKVVFVATGRTKSWQSSTQTDAQSNLNWYGVAKNLWIELNLPYVKANHSCYPNIGIDGTRIFVALRNIQVEEELLFDYSITDDELSWSMDYVESDGVHGTIGPIQTISEDRFLRSYPYIPKYFIKVFREK